jgi:ribosomal 50S subunit-recycling heat shock protein
VNGSKAKASKEIKPGDKIEIKRRTRHTSVEVVNVPGSNRFLKMAAADLYHLTEDIAIDDNPDQLSMSLNAAV